MPENTGDASQARHYRLTLFREDRTMTPVGKTVVRDKDAEAIDSAQRWLRLVRNAHKGQPRIPDHWSVAIAVEGRLPRIIASGSVDAAQ